MTHLILGQKAPDFNLSDQYGNMHSLSDYKGRWLLIFFYPKDMTPGCTIEASTFRDYYERFRELDCKIIGVSGDTCESHLKFAEKESLPYPLLADTDFEMCKAYDVLEKKQVFGKKADGILRTSFLIDPDGKIVRIYDDVKPADHVEDVLFDLRFLQDEHVSA